MPNEIERADRADEPRAVIGGNAPPIAEQLAMHYETIEEDTAAAEREAGRLPKPVTSAGDVAKYADHARVVKNVQSRVAAAEEKEKRPFMNAKDAVMGYFSAFHNKNGTGRLDDVLTEMRKPVKAWQDEEAAKKKAAAEAEAERLRQVEQARLAAAQEEARRLAAEEQERQRLAAEALAAQAPAPAPIPSERAAQVQEHLHQADAAGHGARMADKVAAAPNADHVRVRSNVGGGMATSTTFWDFEILDYEAIEPAKLWYLIPDKEKQRLVGMYVREHRERAELAGVRIFQNTRTDWR